ncbi:MAG: HIT domain-containing protein [Acidobacteria bacterium]|nr:HIT domain-containing protein [Acidobacteriota bacterium]MCI0724205.1 HIT domain-containing protein [Acidobacteriota bacterium]
MDYLWTPWRYQYIASLKNPSRCVFCIETSGECDQRDFIVFRGKSSFVILNIFPYTTGHLLVAPYAHTSDFQSCSPEESAEMLELAKRCQFALAQTYHPDGFNLGMNLGRCAGAGVEHHLHLHVVPRWIGDSNFMTIVGESRVLPESLETTYAKLRQYFS